MSTGSTIETREELINNLTEAAELEHGLLCQYLFAAFSLRKKDDADHEAANDRFPELTWQQVEMIREWEAVILLVARQEMAHLGTVCNLLTAVGGSPQFRRPNFPQSARYFSYAGEPDIEFTLEPFSEQSLKRFIRFERPLEPPARPIVPRPPKYTTVGDLYGQIADAFRRLPEKTLFIGPRPSQESDDWAAGLKLFSVTGKRTAVQAIKWIIEEGEGTPTGGELSHYDRFIQIYGQLTDELGRTPRFQPAWPVLPNPLTQPHHDSPQGGNIICADYYPRRGPDRVQLPVLPCRIAGLSNRVYGTMLLILMQFWAFAGETAEQREGLRATARQMMSGVVRPLGEILTRMPLGEEYPGCTAGPGFELYTDLQPPHDRRNAWLLIHERLIEDATDCRDLAEMPGAPLRLAYLQTNLEGLALNVGRLINAERS